jgi:fructuronate reductase
VRELVARVDGKLAEWAETAITYASTAVDRITPATTDDDRARIAAALGFADRSPVVTEPFSEWVISGDFPAGRPAWQTSGALFVPDTAPYEARKLTLLNGSHSLMAYAAPLRGHETVNEAIADHVVRGWVDAWWDEACRHLPLATDALAHYRSALLERYANPRIEHRLAQIAADGTLKLPVRILPTVRAERAAGRLPVGAARALAAWTLSVRMPEGPSDPRRDTLLGLARRPTVDAVPALVAELDPVLAADGPLISLIIELAGELQPV